MKVALRRSKAWGCEDGFWEGVRLEGVSGGFVRE